MATQRFVGKLSVNGGPPQDAVFVGEAQDLGFWGGVAPPWVDNTLPGPQPKPEHPIVIIPPGAIDGEHPAHPIFLPVYPSHPIVLPPEEPPADPGFIWVYTDQYGWVLDPQGGGKPRPLP